MVELVHDDIVVKIGGRLFREALGIEGLNGQKQVVDALRLIAAHKHLTEIGVLEHRAEGVQALLEDLLPVRHKQQTAGSIRILLTEALVIQGRDDRLAGTGGSHHQIAGVAADGTLRLQPVQYFLLVGIGVNIHGINFGIVGVEVFFRFQRPRQPFPLILRIIFKFPVIPVILKGSGDLVNGFGQVTPRYFCVPFQAAGQCGVGKIGGAHIGRREAGFAVENIRLGVETGRLGVVADLDLRIGQPAQLLDGFHIGSANVGGGDDAKLAAVLRKLPQLVHDEPQATPLDEGHQHVDAVGRDDLLFKLGKHLRLVNGSGEK